MTTLIPVKPFADAVGACAACLERDPLRFHPGRMRITRTPDAVVVATATRNEQVKTTFRIPCDAGEVWVAVLDADATSRLAKALRAMSAGKSKGNGGGLEVERSGTSLVVSAGGQRITVHAGDPQDEQPDPPDGESRVLTGATDLASRIGDAMTFCAPAEGREVAKGPFMYFRESDGHLDVAFLAATDGHRLYLDGDAQDCRDDGLVFQVPGDYWKPAVKALSGRFNDVKLVRRVVPQPHDGDEDAAARRPEKFVTHLVFEAADREVRFMVDEPQTSLPRWHSFLPRETTDPDFSVTCDRAELAHAVKGLSVPATGTPVVCMLRAFGETGMLRLCVVTDYDGGMAQQEIPAEMHGAFTGYVHLNPRYVLDALTVVRTERVRMFQSHSPLDSVRLVEVAEEGTSLRPRGLVVMPVRGRDPVEEMHGEDTADDGTPDAAADATDDGSAIPVAAAADETASVASAT